jgi:hypothetical protein
MTTPSAPPPDTPEPDDEHERRRDNLVLMIGFAGLVGAGIWLLMTMAEVRKAQDCAAQGRRNCTTIESSESAR